MTYQTPLKLVSDQNPPRPQQPEEVADDEEFIFSLPAGVAEELEKNVGNKGPATQPPRPLPGRSLWSRIWPWG